MDLGHQLDETELKQGLRELNSDIHFDLGSRHDLDHPSINLHQAVHYREKHLTTISRNTSECLIPEYTVWQMVRVWVPERHGYGWGRHRALRYGWRVLFEELIKAEVPGLTRASLAAKFGVPYRDRQSVLDIEKKYPPKVFVDKVA